MDRCEDRLDRCEDLSVRNVLARDRSDRSDCLELSGSVDTSSSDRWLDLWLFTDIYLSTATPSELNQIYAYSVNSPVKSPAG